MQSGGRDSDAARVRFLPSINPTDTVLEPEGAFI